MTKITKTAFSLLTITFLLFTVLLPVSAEGEDPLTGEGSIDDHTDPVVIKPPVKK